MATARATFVDDSGDVRLSGYLTIEDGTFTVDGPLAIVGGAAADFENLLTVSVTEGAVFQVDGGGEVTITQRDAGASPLTVTALGGGTIINVGSDKSVQFNGGVIATDVSAGDKLGFFKAPAAAKPTVAGAKLPSDVVLASLLTALVALGLVTDNST